MYVLHTRLRKREDTGFEDHMAPMCVKMCGALLGTMSELCVSPFLLGSSERRPSSSRTGLEAW